MKKLFLALIPIALLALAGCNNGQASNPHQKIELTISAAASLQDALKEMKQEFEKEHPDINLLYNFGASGTLQQQISQGAPADLFLSAAEDKMDRLVQEGYIENKNRKDIAGNEVVLVVPKNETAIRSFEDLKKAKNLSIGTPNSVPAGKYGKETLEHMNLWNELQQKVVYAKDVRQVLAYVESGSVDAGLVYKTDALTSKKVTIVEEAAPASHSPIVYPAGMVKNSKHPKEALLFYEFLQKDSAQKVLKKYGFNEVR
ncbi:molybdate ABC transporter substrate-binding protein [Metabacillus sp. RGM 3146]|uniref:molybdate ABC transporter substrate-binding protein n=1 Tax=Metabacillus sp. RGM 3146 TaxID=3401092 RepID=UPI003B9D26F4